jgi:DNA-binding transcriptional MerR regulator
MFFIGEVARRIGRSPSWVRKAELKHGITPARIADGRKGGSTRIYSPEDVELLLRIRDSHVSAA